MNPTHVEIGNSIYESLRQPSDVTTVEYGTELLRRIKREQAKLKRMQSKGLPISPKLRSKTCANLMANWLVSMVGKGRLKASVADNWYRTLIYIPVHSESHNLESLHSKAA